MSEIRIHKSLNHKNVVNFQHFFEDKENVYILLELCENQTLNEVLKNRKNLLEIEARCYTKQICDGLMYLHENKIIHRDLKLGNIFLSRQMEIKIGDFGLAVVIDVEGEKRMSLCGTPNYIAPEVLDTEGHSYEVDVWSLGCIIFTMIAGYPPFESQNVKMTYQKIKDNEFHFPQKAKFSPLAKDLITKILTHDPEDRLTVQQILEHPWMNQDEQIPDFLPPSCLYDPPTAAFIN